MEHWEFYIGLGVQTILFLGGGYGMVLRNDWSTQALNEKMDKMELQLQKLADVITMQAVQTTRLDNMSSQLASVERRVEDLRRGNGFVRGRGGIDGEHP